MARTRRFWTEWLAAFVFSAGLCAYFQFLTPYLPEEDSYFHIKFAWLLRHHGFFRSGFPWAQFSLWRDGFSDASTLYHLILVPFTFFGDLAFGIKVAAVLLSAFAFSSFYAILTLNDVRGRLYWFWLLLAGGGFFWWRWLVPRPQVLSAALLLWSLHFLINGRRKGFAALSFVYPLSYVAAFLPQVFAAVRWAYLKVAARRSDSGVLAAGVAFYALGMIVHPYFPKNLEYFWVQNFYVMFLGVTKHVNLFLANELMPLDTRQFLGGNAPLITHVLVLLYVAMHRRKPLSERTRVLFPIALILFFLTCASRRFLEYSVPVTTLLCAFLFTDACEGYGEAELERDLGRWTQPLILAWLLAMGAATGVEASMVRRDFRKTEPPRFKELAQTLSEHAPPGETVYTCDWDEPPELLYFADQYRYPVILDPTFMYYWNPAIWQKWFDVSNARLSADETRSTLLDTFHARYGVCGSKFGTLRSLMGADPRFTILAENPNGWAFEVR